MNKASLLSSALALCCGNALAQIQHFPELEWKEKQTDHFTIRTNRTGTDPAKKYCEEVWEKSQEILTGLEEDFTDNKFRTPGGEKGSDEAPFRFTVYLIGTGHRYTEVLDVEKGRHGWGNDQIRSCKVTQNYRDPLNRYNVFCKVDPETSGGGSEKDMTSVFIHSTGACLLSGRARSSNLPFWHTAGFGYYIEHVITDRCRVLYLDFQKYYQDNGDAELVRGGVLGPGSPWPPAIKKLCKENIRVSLDKVCKADILTLSPNTSGYMFALTYFLVSTEERRENYRKFVAESRDGSKITKELLLSTYGYEDDAALEEDWYEFILSRDFK